LRSNPGEGDSTDSFQPQHLRRSPHPDLSRKRGGEGAQRDWPFFFFVGKMPSFNSVAVMSGRVGGPALAASPRGRAPR